MRALLIVAAALAVLAAASPTSPTDNGPDGRHGRHGLNGWDAATAALADATVPICPPKQPEGPHCVYLTLKKPSNPAAEKLAKKLRTDGVESDVTEDGRVSVSLSDAQLEKLLGAKVRYSLTAASASDRMLCDAQVASFKAPARYAEVAAVRIDAQCP